MATTSAKQNVLVLGSGAVGLLYGGRLLEAELSKTANLNVHFVLRRDFDLCSKHGFKILSDDGDAYFSGSDLHGRIHDHNLINAGVISFERIDLIICAFKSTVIADAGSRSEVKSLLSKIITKTTKILVLMNGLLCEEYFVKWFGSAAVFGGMAFTCINRLRKENGDEALVIHHMAHGALQIGHCQDDPALLAQHIQQYWAHTKIGHKVSTTDSLLRSRWLKLCWNIPFNGLAVALGGTSTDVVVTDPDLRVLADEIMRDVISLANAHILSCSTIERKTTVAIIPIDMDETRKFCWHLADTIGAYKTSTVLDLIQGNSMESEYIFGKALDIAMEMSPTSCEVVQSSFLDCKNIIGASRWPRRSNWMNLERVVRSVFAIERIARVKAAQGTCWLPTLLT